MGPFYVSLLPVLLENSKIMVALILFVEELLRSLVLNIGRLAKLFRSLYILRRQF